MSELLLTLLESGPAHKAWEVLAFPWNKSIDQKIPFITKEKWMAQEQNLNKAWMTKVLCLEEMDNIPVAFSEIFTVLPGILLSQTHPLHLSLSVKMRNQTLNS